jgi:copper chaperone CopZ
MKTMVISLVAALALPAAALAAEVSAEITDVHLCCKGCVNGVEKAIADVAGAKAAVDADAGKVTLTGPDAATVQKAADALVAGGYFGKSSDGHVKLKAVTGAKGQKVQSLQIEGVHLCCGKCVKAVDQAVKSVPGVTTQNATKGAKTFEVSGDFNDKDVFAALQKEGFSGKVAKQ